MLRQGTTRLSQTLAMHHSNLSLRADGSPDLLSLSLLKLDLFRVSDRVMEAIRDTLRIRC